MGAPVLPIGGVDAVHQAALIAETLQVTNPHRRILAVSEEPAPYWPPAEQSQLLAYHLVGKWGSTTYMSAEPKRRLGKRQQTELKKQRRYIYISIYIWENR